MGKHSSQVDMPLMCGCVHIDSVWVTRTDVPCLRHPCSLCNMRAGQHAGHVHIVPAMAKAPEYLYDV